MYKKNEKNEKKNYVPVSSCLTLYIDVCISKVNNSESYE